VSEKTEKFESVPCAICKKNDQSHFLSKDRFNIVKCNTCGLIYVNPRLKKEYIFQRYSKDYFVNEYLPALTKDKLGKEQHYTNLLNNVKGFIGFLRKPDDLSAQIINLFEIGCGAGLLLKIASDKFNFNVKGIELNPYCIEYAEKELGLTNKISCKDIDICDISYYQNTDIIIMDEVIEHLLDPFGILLRCFNGLNNKGVLFVSTPNIESKKTNIGPTEHLYYFSVTTLKLMLENIGFKILGIDYSDPENKEEIFMYCAKEKMKEITYE